MRAQPGSYEQKRMSLCARQNWPTAETKRLSAKTTPMRGSAKRRSLSHISNRDKSPPGGEPRNPLRRVTLKRKKPRRLNLGFSVSYRVAFFATRRFKLRASHSIRAHSRLYVICPANYRDSHTDNDKPSISKVRRVHRIVKHKYRRWPACWFFSS